MISKQNEVIGIREGKRTQENTFHQREDGGGGADAESQSDDDGQSKAGRFQQLAEGKAEVVSESGYTSS